MFLINLKYKKCFSEIEKELANHIIFLNKYYELNKFLLSGPKEPRNGGLILCSSNNIDEVNAIIEEDPFKIHDLAEFEITEFIPTGYQEEFKKYIG